MARSARRRGWLAVGLCVAVLVAGVVVYAAVSPGAQLQPVAVHVPPAGTTGHDRALAAAEAERVLTGVPVPPGAKAATTPPARSLRRDGAQIQSVDPSLTHTAWWIVPVPYTELVAWYAHHTPSNPATTRTPDSTAPVPDGQLYWELHTRSTAFTQPAVIVSYARLGPTTTGLRVDVTLAARYDRTAATLVPATVTSIDVTRTAIDGPSAGQGTTVTVTDPAHTTRIVQAFDHLLGSPANAEGEGCGSPAGIQYDYAVTFHWPGHSLRAGPGAELCGVGRPLTLDGTRLPQTLDDDEALDDALAAATS